MKDLHERLSTFLEPYLSTPSKDGRPLTITTWAQSLDGKIAPGTRTPLALSSLETKYMTHLIRRQTDAILIGAETAVTDNPSLNGTKVTEIDLTVARIPVNGLQWEWLAAKMEEQPRPVILDPNCRAHLPKLLHLVTLGQAKSPWILCRSDIAQPDDRYIPMKTENGQFSWEDILSVLSSRGIKSVMIEGGANVISDVLSQRMADVIIITIAPVFLGRDGVGIAPVLQEEWLHDTHTISIGKDIVIGGRIRKI
jgi:2,5-diamino-6-(ribosylamino)-4(3H)-pyrimidinone 5'-phosphate reductase